MTARWKAILAAFVAASVVNFAGVMFVLNPVAKTDSAGEPLVSPVVGFFVYVLLTIALFDWAARQMSNAYKAALVVGASQFLLVNVDFVLSGKRGLLTAGASTLLIILTWTSVAFAWAYFVGRVETKGGGAGDA